MVRDTFSWSSYFAAQGKKKPMPHGAPTGLVQPKWNQDHTIALAAQHAATMFPESGPRLLFEPIFLVFAVPLLNSNEVGKKTLTISMKEIASTCSET